MRSIMKSIGILLFSMIVLNITAQNNIKQDTFSVYAEEDWYEDDPYFWSNSREIGLNVTQLASKFVPFNFVERPEGLIGLTYKKYYSKRALRVAFGANLTGKAEIENSSFLHMSIGLERRYPITKDKKFSYTSGWEAAFTGDTVDATIGVSKIYGLEYHITKRLFLSTEAALSIGFDIDFGEPIIRFSPPSSIFVNVRLY